MILLNYCCCMVLGVKRKPPAYTANAVLLNIVSLMKGDLISVCPGCSNLDSPGIRCWKTSFYNLKSYSRGLFSLLECPRHSHIFQQAGGQV